ncbi:MAG: 2-oxoacid:acceptor oxidoreductase subunit alpha [Thermodesulfobacteriota bacterium]
MDFTLRIGGKAGQGLPVIGGVLAKHFSRSGFHVFTHQDYMSRIRGGHNFYQIRFADHKISCSRDNIDLLLALDADTINIHRHNLSDIGKILYDPEMCGAVPGKELIAIPFTDLVNELDVNHIMVNSAAVGAVLALLGQKLHPFDEIFGSFISQKGAEVIATNVMVAQAGFDYARREWPGQFSLSSPGNDKKNMLMNGNQAIGLGALMSGCKFYSAYPMPPSTGIMDYLASKAEEHGVVVEQAEDEISAINMALGASYAGVRAMTATSGGGFALMTEGVSLAGITETPIVVAEVQRPGPATGLPSRTEQSDLFFVIHGGHGEFAKVVFTPGTPEQAFYLTNKAFQMAEKYQVPVFVQSDQYLADSQWSLSGFKADKVLQEDFRLRGQQLNTLENYQRYAYTKKGISPLAIPGESRHLVVVDSDEHDQDGHIIEDGETRNEMVAKRLFKKIPHIQEEIEPPQLYGDQKPDFLLVGFGSTYGVLKEAVDNLREQWAFAMLHFSEVYPFPLTDKFDYVSLLNQAITICVENNATGQFANLLRLETGYRCNHLINRYDGRPFGLESLLGELYDYL